MSSEAFISCVVYIDAARLADVATILNRASETLRNLYKSSELVAVIDTNTATSADDLGGLEPPTSAHLVVVDLAYQQGIERAMMAGTQIAVGDFVVEVDAPSPTFPFEVLGELLSYAQKEGIDIVGGVPKEGVRRSSKTFYRLLRRLGISNHMLATETVRVVSRRTLNRALTDRRKLRYRKLLYTTTGFEYQQIPLSSLPAPERTGTWHRLALALDLLTGGSRIGSVTAAAMAIFFLLLSVGLGLYALVVWLVGLPVTPGWTTIMAFLSIGFAGVFAVLSVIARMISIVLDELLATAPFSVREVLRAPDS